MNADRFRATLDSETPPVDIPKTLAALWWDAKGDWTQAHALVDELETLEGMAVHAYLHRKEGAGDNAEYWYRKAGRSFYRPEFWEEWVALVEGLAPD